MSDVARDDFKDNFQNLFEIEATEIASEILMPSGAILRLAGSKGFRT
jgi:Zn-dependent peptidase ImmA (M78 family)